MKPRRFTEIPSKKQIDGNGTSPNSPSLVPENSIDQQEESAHWNAISASVARLRKDTSPKGSMAPRALLGILIRQMEIAFAESVCHRFGNLCLCQH